MAQSKKIIADLVLVFVTVSWGLTFPLIANAVNDVSPVVFVTLRFLIAALILLPLVYSRLHKASRGVIWAGFVLGLLNVATYLTQTIGLETITSARAAFITGINVVIVPFLMPFFRVGKVRAWDFGCALICMFGLYILTSSGHERLAAGDFWVLITAVSYAFVVVYLQKVTQKYKELDQLAFYQILFTGLLVSLFSWHHSFHGVLKMDAIIGLLFCAIMATSLALWLQTRYQRYTTASRAALIFTLEPIFGALFGFLINGEALTWRVFLGGGVIIAAILISEFSRIISEKIRVNV